MAMADEADEARWMSGDLYSQPAGWPKDPRPQRPADDQALVGNATQPPRVEEHPEGTIAQQKRPQQHEDPDTFVLTAWAEPLPAVNLERADVFYSHHQGAYCDYTDQYGRLLLMTYFQADDPLPAARELIDGLERLLTIRIIELDYDLTDLRDISDRAGTAAHDIITRHRPSTDFPPPFGHVWRGLKVWDWESVNTWLRTHGLGDAESPLNRQQIATLNAWLATRTNQNPQLTTPIS